MDSGHDGTAFRRQPSAQLLSCCAAAAMAVMTSAQLVAADPAADSKDAEPQDLAACRTERIESGCRMLSTIVAWGTLAASLAAAQGAVSVSTCHSMHVGTVTACSLWICLNLAPVPWQRDGQVSPQSAEIVTQHEQLLLCRQMEWSAF